MNIKNLVLDSNFLMRDVNFTSKDIVLLITLADYHKLKLIIPSVVYDECVGRYNVETTALRGSILSLLSKYKRKIVDIEKARIDDTGIIDKLNEVSSYYIYSIERFIKNNNISKVPYPSVHHDVIVKKMYEGKLPFKNERVELGYKDFLIVNSIKEHLDQGDVTVILSENAKDFCDGNVSNSCEKGKKNNKKNQYQLVRILIPKISIW
ncbi:PIN domain-containing protein [Morganella morganii]|uniref:PIN domain-containing protein n=1 Tax=Morganella morganii TaxID=582 RepID=A0A9Q4CN72_MORMO|nr:PIN domain-containing protein [Morganella morganii]MCY0788946.1 PIN domain-containing protein [Morganella morganii]